ncbi:MAG: nucleoid-associated protein EbfC [Campylobacterota bacterium]|nr:nucleoid-associated protein EbfC [Campylobacterota bacterium]
MFDKLDMGNLSEMLSEVQKKTQEIQNINASKTYQAKSGGGMVCVKANGKGEINDIEIDDSLLQDKDSLQILLISAINEVLKEIESGKRDAAMNMLSGFNPFMKK